MFTNYSEDPRLGSQHDYNQLTGEKLMFRESMRCSKGVFSLGVLWFSHGHVNIMLMVWVERWCVHGTCG